MAARRTSFTRLPRRFGRGGEVEAHRSGSPTAFTRAAASAASANGAGAPTRGRGFRSRRRRRARSASWPPRERPHRREPRCRRRRPTGPDRDAALSARAADAHDGADSPGETDGFPRCPGGGRPALGDEVAGHAASVIDAPGAGRDEGVGRSWPPSPDSAANFRAADAPPRAQARRFASPSSSRREGERSFQVSAARVAATAARPPAANESMQARATRTRRRSPRADRREHGLSARRRRFEPAGVRAQSASASPWAVAAMAGLVAQAQRRDWDAHYRHHRSELSTRRTPVPQGRGEAASAAATAPLSRTRRRRAWFSNGAARRERAGGRDDADGAEFKPSQSARRSRDQSAKIAHGGTPSKPRDPGLGHGRIAGN